MSGPSTTLAEINDMPMHATEPPASGMMARRLRRQGETLRYLFMGHHLQIEAFIPYIPAPY